MILKARQLYEGQSIPRFYGMAWVDVATRTYTAFPIPFHWLARWGRSLWWRFKVPISKSWWEQKMDGAFAEGRLGAYKDGQEQERRNWDALLTNEIDRLGKKSEQHN